MIIDNYLFCKLEKLTMLNFNEEEREIISKDMQKILDYMKLLDEYDITSEDAMVSPVELENAVRDDIPQKGMSREDFLKNAKNVKENLIAVPEIF